VNSVGKQGGTVSELSQINAQIRVCTKCALHKGRTKAVPGEGPEDAVIIFIGEAPGFHEDRQGRPFVGAAGKFLEELLSSIGLQREEVYITNVIKCRPPGNRDPLPEELDTCAPYLTGQIELIKPKLIVTLGRFSMARYFSGVNISRIHGQPKRVGDVIVYPIFHPAAALHQPKYRSMIEEDIKKIPALLEAASQIEETEPPPQAQQLSLF
jgi:uracil-DNA glycosylase family 4